VTEYKILSPGGRPNGIRLDESQSSDRGGERRLWKKGMGDRMRAEGTGSGHRGT
jgi:hypothetical protein